VTKSSPLRHLPRRRWRPVQINRLAAVNVATHAVRHLTRSPTGTDGDLEPAISPDGQTIAFLRPVSYGVHDIHLVGIDGSNEHRLRDNRDEIQGITWMPNGKELLLCARKGTEPLHILRMDIQSGRSSSIWAKSEARQTNLFQPMVSNRVLIRSLHTLPQASCHVCRRSLLPASDSLDV